MALLQQGLAVTEGFASWPAAAMQKLLPVARLGRYERGAPVHSEDEGEAEVLVVLSGHLMMRRLNTRGAGQSVTIVGPGVPMGIARGLEHKGEPTYAYHAHDNAVVAHLPARVVLGILDAEPTLWKDMAGLVIRQQRQLLTTLLHHLSGSVSQRLAGTLSRFVQARGDDENVGSLRLRLSQDDLAAMLQVTRQSINREMRAFESRGLVKVSYGTVVVSDVASLRKLGRSS